MHTAAENRPKTDMPTYEHLLLTLFKGTNCSRHDARDKIERLANALELSPRLIDAQIENYVDRVRLYQEIYRERIDLGYIGVGLVFHELPQVETDVARDFLEQDRARG